jgi:hypothetical protein
MASKTAQYKITEVSPATWSITPAALDETPGPREDGGFIVRVVGLPLDFPARSITDKLARVADLTALPAVIDWNEWPK